ncbi:MAG: hypothetical protein SVX38_05160, partial [Chloroflexota bacterium]|nr:hypothetical protein [Chloroflexota bacterium]
ITPGGELHLILYWQAESALETDYTVFVHLLDAAGRRVSGWDSPPLAGDYPTSAWDAGEIIADEYIVPVPADAAPGEHTIAVGMYSAHDGLRLPVLDAYGVRLPDDAVLLEELTIEER